MTKRIPGIRTDLNIKLVGNLISKIVILKDKIIHVKALDTKMKAEKLGTLAI
jgi:hypothetical protein